MDMTVEVPELPELTFDEASHIYRLNGDIIPSVSKLMEPLKDQCYGGISKRTLENAAIKGSAVHRELDQVRHRRYSVGASRLLQRLHGVVEAV